MQLRIKRQYFDDRTMGSFKTPNGSIYYTIEKPWRDNTPFYSCIPEGIYECEPYSSEKFPDVWQLLDVPDRTYILIHVGNYPQDVQGCIAVGRNKVTNIINEPAYITESVKAIKELREILPYNFSIRIERDTRYVEHNK